MEDRGRIPLRERTRQLVAPLDCEPVRVERVVLHFELSAFVLVSRDTKASGGPKCIAGDLRKLS